MADIDVSSFLHPGHLVVALRGELDISDAPGLARALSAAAGSGSPIIEPTAFAAKVDAMRRHARRRRR